MYFYGIKYTSCFGLVCRGEIRDKSFGFLLLVSRGTATLIFVHYHIEQSFRSIR